MSTETETTWHDGHTSITVAGLSASLHTIVRLRFEGDDDSEPEHIRWRLKQATDLLDKLAEHLHEEEVRRRK